MPNERRVKFALSAGDPVLLQVQALNGEMYQLRLTVVVFEVAEVEGEQDPTGNPRFNVRAGTLMDVKKAEVQETGDEEQG